MKESVEPSSSKGACEDPPPPKEETVQEVIEGSKLSYSFELPSRKSRPRAPDGDENSGQSSPESLSDDNEDDDDSIKLSTPSMSRSPSPIRRPSSASRRSTSALYLPTVDKMSSAVVNGIVITFAAIVFGVFVIGSYDYLKNFEANKCEMTFMYRVPQFVQLPISQDLKAENGTSFPMYKLYAYVEGNGAHVEAVKTNQRFTGIPVLYIPGNAGSYKQVRSLASVALWKHVEAETPFHFDFFTVDLNEEMSGLYGYPLQRQVQFVKQALSTIINFYEDYHQVILIGHSMGGVVAKAAAIDDSGSTLSNLILTFGTPHERPVLTLDPALDLFYHFVKRNWNLSGDVVEKIALVSVAGGDRDVLVPAKLTRWPNAIHSMSTGIPGVWASTDHLCMVWCKQLVLTTIRALFDLVEFNQRNKYYSISENMDKKLGVLKYHFQERQGSKSFHGNGKQPKVILSKLIDQVEATSGMICRTRGQRDVFLVYPRSFLLQNVTKAESALETKDFDDYNIIVMSTNTKQKEWIMGCFEVSLTGQCVQAESLFEYSRIMPHIKSRKRIAILPLSLLTTKYSHLVIKMDTQSVKTCTLLETFNSAQRTLELGGKMEANQKMFYNFTITHTGFPTYMAAWKVSVTPSGTSCPEAHQTLGQFRHGNFMQSNFLKNESLLVRHSDWNSSISSVQVYLEPTCNYTITTTFSPLETAGQFFRASARLIPSFYTAVVLMTLYFQKDPSEWSSFHVILISHAYHLSVVPGFVVSVLLLCVPTDWPQVMDPGEFSVILPITSFLIAYCLVLLVSSATWYAIITSGTALHSGLIRILSSRFGSWVPSFLANRSGFTSVTQHVAEAAFEITLTRFPFAVAAVVMAISAATCGSLGISLVLGLFIVKLFKIYEDLLEDLLKAKITNMKDSLSPMNFHFSCYMLWMIVTILNVPGLLHWCRSPTLVSEPQWDMSMYVSILIIPTISVLWQDFVPNMDPLIWKLHRYVFYVMGFVCVLWGTHRLYIISFILTLTFLTMTVCQLVSVVMSYLTKVMAMNAAASSPVEPEPQTSSSSTNRG